MSAAATAFSKWLETALDAEAAAHPNPGHPAIHRLNRAEYSNAIRDIFELDVNAGALLPVDDSGYGFDNIGDVLSLSPTLLDRYLSVARKISRLAVGDLTIKPVEEAFEPRRETGGQRPVSSEARMGERRSAVQFGRRSFGAALFPAGRRVRSARQFREWTAGKAVELRLPIKAGLRTVAVTFPRESLRPEILADGRAGRAPPRRDCADRRGSAAGWRQLEAIHHAGADRHAAAPDQPVHRRTFQCHRPRRYAQPPQAIRSAIPPGRGRKRLRPADPGPTHPPRLPAAGDRCGCAAAAGVLPAGARAKAPSSTAFRRPWKRC